MKNKVAAVIPAAGIGRRMESDVSKQYIEVEGKPIIAYTLESFEQCDDIDEVVLVVEQDQIEAVEKMIVTRFNFNKVKAVVSGGQTRQASVYEGLKVLNEDVKIVLVHDGARPMITKDQLTYVVDETLKHSATVMAVPVKDTIKIVDSEGYVELTPKRSALYNVQTPQSFEMELLMNAYKSGIEAGFSATDDAMMVEQFSDRKIKIIDGSYNNRKITTPDDLAWMKLMINN